MVVLDENVEQQAVVEPVAKVGIDAGPASVAAHSQEVYHRQSRYQPSHLPVWQELGSRGLALPLCFEMTDEQSCLCAGTLRRIIEEPK
jgi:dTDP-4-amino-4,6-dideoxygalactose transaminase